MTHGTLYGYQIGCRCDDCVARKSADARERRARWRAEGLTSYGKPYKRPPDTPVTDDPRRTGQREHMRRKRASLYAAGLTAKGKPPSERPSGRPRRLA